MHRVKPDVDNQGMLRRRLGQILRKAIPRSERCHTNGVIDATVRSSSHGSVIAAPEAQLCVASQAARNEVEPS